MFLLTHVCRKVGAKNIFLPFCIENASCSFNQVFVRKMYGHASFASSRNILQTFKRPCWEDTALPLMRSYLMER